MALIENFTERVVTSADTRRRAVERLGFDELPISQKLNRADYATDEEFFDAVARLSVQHNSPEYRAAYREIRRQYNAQQEAERQAQEEARHQQELAQAIKDCVLRPEEQAAVDDAARSRAQADLAAGRISYQQLGDTVTRYAGELTQSAKVEKVHHADLNAQLRAAMAQVLRR